jgi:hypothetical protein
MSAIASKSVDTRNSLLRSIALGGSIIFILQFTHIWIVATLIQGSPFTAVWQYIASGALGMAGRYHHRLARPALSLDHFLFRGWRFQSADRIPLLRHYAIPGALLYGLGVHEHDRDAAQRGAAATSPNAAVASRASLNIA